jgi:hypothetical protein
MENLPERSVRREIFGFPRVQNENGSYAQLPVAEGAGTTRGRRDFKIDSDQTQWDAQARGAEKSRGGGIRCSRAGHLIGFVIASAIFSFAPPADLVAGTRWALTEIRTWWFAIALSASGSRPR